MPIPRQPTRLAALVGAMLFASLLSCGREVTGPDGRGGRAGAVLLDPRFATIRLGGTGEVLSIGSVVEFDRVRVVLHRSDGSVAVDTLIPFPPNVETVSLRMSITIDPQAPAAGEPLTLTMKYVNIAGDTVFSGGPVGVIAKPSSSGTPAPVPVEIDYVGAGANAKSILITPPGYTGLRLATTSFAATVLDSSDAPLPLAPVAFTSTDSQRVSVNLRTGSTSLLGARGGAKIIAQTLTGQADTADVAITPVATSLVLVSGGSQQTRQAEAFPQPIRVRANAVDNLGVAGVVIAFDVLQGQGTTSQVSDTTDANGDAEVSWIAGDSAGAAILRASIFESAIGVNIGGQQLSSAATALTFGTQPGNITAGAAIPALTVVVRDATADTVAAYNSAVTLALTGGTAGANLVGTSTVNAVAGVAVFSGLTVDRGGTGYRVVATLPPLPGVPAAQSNTFNVAAAPPQNLTLFQGGGQTALPLTALADSIRVRVTDTFGFPVAGVAVSFAVSAGGGSVSPSGATTTAAGIASTRWTLGAAGTQQITATASGLTPLVVGASLPVVGETPVLFLGVDSIGLRLGRTRQVPVLLTNPAPTPATITLTVRDTTASWSVPSLLIPSGQNAAYPVLTGAFVGSTWAVVSSAYGTDSVFVLVDSLTAVIDGPLNIEAYLGDTIRTIVRLDEPAPAGGLTFTVRSTDSSMVLVAPATGLGMPEEVCATCSDLRAAPSASATLLAPLAGTAIVTIPAGQLSAQLAILPIAYPDGAAIPLLLEAAGVVGIGISVTPQLHDLTNYLYDTRIAVGHRGEFYLYRNTRSRDETRIRVRSLNPAVLSVDSIVLIRRDDYYSDYNFFTALSVGTAGIVAEIPGVIADTQFVDVLSGRLSANIASGVSLSVGAVTELSVSLGIDDGGFWNFGGYVGSPRTTTVTSRNPAVAVPEFGQARVEESDYSSTTRIVALAAGSTWLVAEAPGYASDSAFVTVSGSGLSVQSNEGLAGVGLLEEYFRVDRLESGTPGQALTVTLTSSAPSIARVLTPSLTISAGYSSAWGRIEGVSTGTATITASAPGVTADSIPFQVYPAEVALSAYAFPATLDPDSAQRGISSNVGANGSALVAADTVFGVLRSTNPAVLLVTDSIVRYLPFNFWSNDGVFSAIAPGTAQLIVTGLGAQLLVPDTSAVLTVRPPRLSFSAVALPVGRRLQTLTSVSRTTSTSASLPFSVSVQGPAGVSVLNPADAIPAGSVNRLVTILAGNTLGLDTVIVTAAGMTPDTVFVTVYGTRASAFNVPTVLDVGDTAQFVDVRLRNVGNSAVQPTRDTALVRLIARDTTIVKVLTDTFRILPGSPASAYGGIRGTAPGSTWLVTEHLNGLSVPDSIKVTVRTPKLLMSYYGDPLVMGMQERTVEYDLFVQRTSALSTALWVRLTSSAPAIASVPDSILLPAYQSFGYFQVTSGDTTGSAMVLVSGDGYASTAFAVHVTRSFLETYQTLPVVPGGRGGIQVWRENANYDAFPSLVDIPLRFAVSDTSVAKIAPDTLTMEAASSYYVSTSGLLGVAPGRTVYTVSDDRVGTFQRVLSGSGEVDVSFRRLYTGGNSGLVLAPGTRTVYSDYVYTDGLVDSMWVQLRSVGGKFAPSADSVLLRNSLSDYYYLIGIAEGTDTLVFSAPGFLPESSTVRVAEGVLRNYLPWPTIRQGDSVQVSVQLASASQDPLSPDPLPITFSVSTTGALQAANGGIAISTVQVPIDSQSMTFWLKALSAGGGTVTISHPDFVPLVLNVSTRSP